MEKEDKLTKYDKNMKGKEERNENFTFFDPKIDNRFKVEGLAFFDNEHEYYRIPKKHMKDVSEAVAWLSNHPAGGQIRFISNAKEIRVHVKNNGDYQMCHMASTGQQGVDLYYKAKGQKKYHFFSCAKFNEPTIEFEDTIFLSDEEFEKEIIINLPLYEGMESILIGVNESAYIKEPKKHKNEGRYVIYGTSITQGGCASRPGNMFTNIISRDFDEEWINLGFSGSGLGEIELANIINEIENKKLVILDYEANGGATGDMDNNLEPFIDTIRLKNKNIPIIVMSKIKFSVDLYKKSGITKRNHYFNLQKEMVNKKRMNGDNNIYFIDGSKLLGNYYEEGLIDGIHLNDLGFVMLAKNLEKNLRKILK